MTARHVKTCHAMTAAKPYAKTYNPNTRPSHLRTQTWPHSAVRPAARGSNGSIHATNLACHSCRIRQAPPPAKPHAPQQPANTGATGGGTLLHACAGWAAWLHACTQGITRVTCCPSTALGVLAGCEAETCIRVQPHRTHCLPLHCAAVQNCPYMRVHPHAAWPAHHGS